jgi:hypothetical protein
MEIQGKIFSKASFFLFCILLNKNNSKSNPFNTFRKLREGATTFVSSEKSPKWGGACPKKEINTGGLQSVADRLQMSYIDYKVY